MFPFVSAERSLWRGLYLRRRPSRATELLLALSSENSTKGQAKNRKRGATDQEAPGRRTCLAVCWKPKSGGCCCGESESKPAPRKRERSRSSACSFTFAAGQGEPPAASEPGAAAAAAAASLRTMGAAGGKGAAAPLPLPSCSPAHASTVAACNRAPSLPLHFLPE